MKILVKHKLNGEKQRFYLDFSLDSPISELRMLICKKFLIPLPSTQLILKLCSQAILLTDTWPLSFFTTSELVILKLHMLDSYLSHTQSTLSSFHSVQASKSQIFHTNLSPLDHLLQIINSGSLESFQSFLEVNKQEIREEDLLNHEQECKWGALHYACFYGHSEITAAILKFVVNCNKVTIDEWTPLQLACYFGKEECVKVLLNHPNIDINKLTKFRGTGLHLACLKGDCRIVQLLLEKGASLSVEDHRKRLPVEYATISKLFEIIPKYFESQKIKEQLSSTATIFCSEVYILNSFMLHDKLIFLYLDLENGTLNQYKNKEDFLDKRPAEGLKKIQDLQKVVYSESGHQYYFKLVTLKNTIKYYTKHQELSTEWVSRIKLAIEHCRANKIARNRRQSTEMVDDEIVSEEPEFSLQEVIDVNSFNKLDEIGNGSFGTVYKVERISSGEIFAMKALSKSSLNKQKQLKYAISECKIMKQLNFTFIVQLFFAFQTPKYIYLILELCPNGDLFGFIEKKGRLEENVARFYTAEVILALEYLHSLDIIYRDLKPSNVLIDKYGHAKLADFGLAKEKVEKGNLAMTMAGSPAYLPPEIVLKKGASKASDIYGIGPLLFELLTGTTPYYCDDIDGLFQNIKSGKLIFPNYVSSTAKDLISQVMNRDPGKRPQLTQIKRHAFFRKFDWEALLAKRIRPPKLDFVSFEEYDV